jgi:hypothetical protein
MIEGRRSYNVRQDEYRCRHGNKHLNVLLPERAWGGGMLVEKAEEPVTALPILL